MAEEVSGNCLVAQSGGPTAVINASLAGVITEALNHECIEEIYGGLSGVLGILKEDFIDLASESQQTIRGLRYTPSAALGTCRFNLQRAHEFERVLSIFEAHNIHFFFYIGGNDSQDTAARIGQQARECGYELRVIGIPKTVDNDLLGTDHCPGYGSVAKHVATTALEIACDNRAMGQGDLVSVFEVMGRNSGWIAAATSLAKRRDELNDPPHLIYLPEVAFSPHKFIDDVQKVLAKERYCFVVVGEGLVDQDGNHIATSTAQQDSFGNAQLGGAGEYLRGLAEQHLGVKARCAKPGIAQRAAAHSASQSDNDEAFMVGQAAVQAAVSGESEKMVTLIRGDGDQYTCETGLCDLTEVANGVKMLPEDWINEDGVTLNHQFFKYALPLIQPELDPPYENGIPRYVQLDRIRVGRVLPPHVFE